MSFIKKVGDVAGRAREAYQQWDTDGRAAARGRLTRELEQASRRWTLPAVVRHYEPGPQGDRRFAVEAEIFDEHRYEPSMQDVDGGHVHLGRLVLTGGLSILAGRKGIRSKGKMTVTFRQQRVAPAPQPPAAPDPIDQIERLGVLRDQGVLTDEEFQAKKRQLLGL